MVYRFLKVSTGGSKSGPCARVSCMGHLTRQLGRVRPHGRVNGWAMMSMALFSGIVIVVFSNL